MRTRLCSLSLRIAGRRRSNKKSRFRLAAILAHGSNVCAYGINEPRADSFVPSSTHAEVAALRNVYSAEGMDLYVSRILADGTPACSKPCESCMKIIREKKVERIHYIDGAGN
jgi:cytidine deaminase